MTVVKGTLVPLRGKVFVEGLESGQRISAGGILIPDDNAKNEGIRARWGKVYAIGSDVHGINVGEWVLIKHGRWTFGIDVERPDGTQFKVWQIDYPDNVEAASDVFPSELKPVN